ncbi:serine hydrolase domain-containing protein [Sediminibacterium sp.]|uniref:serine hydrolase domain-containing protein n=1 Tax=Sediminibacterium sp. TaxID=1917865 RepID=UPI003F718D64
MKLDLSYTRFLFTVGLFMGFVGCKKTVDNSIQSNIERSLQEMLKNNYASYKQKYPNYPGGVALKILTKKGDYFVKTGLSDDINDQTKFRAASNTKTLTAAAILFLHQQGKLNIEHKITDIIPELNIPYVPSNAAYNLPYKNSITILDLLRHRAGVFDVSNQNIPDTVSLPLPYKGQNYIDYIQQTDSIHTFTFDELVNVVSQCKLSSFIPGNGYHYSNTGYSILGKIIERVSNKTYQQFLIEDVMKPMGMAQSSMPVLGADQQIPLPFAAGYVLYNNTKYNVTISNISANVAEGNLITTPNDLANFLRKLLTGQGILNTNLVNSVMMNYKSTNDINAGGYGCGLTYTNNLGYGHTGAHEGYLSQMVYDPITGFTAVAYTNGWNLEKGMSSLIEQLREILENICYQAKAISN